MRLRYAPSPTGYLHIGNARTALFNYLYTKHNGGEFIVRIEDTDLSRNIEDGVSSQLDNLKWLGIDWDESIDREGKFGPYNQIKRHEEGIYLKYVEQLLAENKAYKCYCTTEELDAEAEKQKAAGLIPKYNGTCRNLTPEQIDAYEAEGRDYTVRFKVDETKSYTWDDIVKGDVTFHAKDVSGDFNILKRDGIPTYNFAVVVDDHLMEISHVLRGEDHISNTPKQMMIYDALGFDYPKFGHMTLIVNEAGKKLSKRDTQIVQFIEEYKQLGYLPDAMFNFMSLLGWSPEGEKEIYSREQLIEIFDEKRLSKSSAKFDVNKLKFINNQYIKKMDDNDYIKLVTPFFDEINNGKYDQQIAEKIMLLYKDQISYGSEIKEVSDLFFNECLTLTDEAKEILQTETVIETFAKLFKQIDEITSEQIKGLIKETGNICEAKGKNLFMPIRIATTGQIHGPDLTTAIELLGKEAVIRNIDQVLKEK